jgi:hypothetical protein
MPLKDLAARRAYYRLYANKWRNENRARHLKTQRAYHKKNIVKLRKKGRDWYAKHREKERAKDRAASRKKLGVTPTRSEPTHCEICGRLPDHFKALCLDHCSLLDKFRGWICTHCNLMLGYAKDNPVTLTNAAQYLKAAYQ